MDAEPAATAAAHATRVLLVVDHDSLLSSAVEHLLAGLPWVDFLGAAEARFGAAALLARAQPDVVLVDASVIGVLSSLKQIASRAHVAVVGEPKSTAARTEMLCEGVLGFIPHDTRPDHFVALLTVVAAGHSVLSSESRRALMGVAQDVCGEGACVDSRRLSTLTSAQRRVLALLADGLSNKQIANEAHISVSTVKTHVHGILMRLGLTRRTEAVGLFLRANGRSLSTPMRHLAVRI